MNKESQVHQALLSAFIDALHKGESVGARDEMLWGDALERVQDEAGSDFLKAQEYMDLLFTQIHRDPNSPTVGRILSGLSKTLSAGLFRLGKYRANPMSKMAQDEPFRPTDAEDIVAELFKSEP